MTSSLFILLFAVYALLSLYVCWRSMQALPRKRWLRACWCAFIVVCAGGFFAGAALREFTLAGAPAGYWLRTLGVTWMITLPYWTCATLLCDAVRLAGRRWHFLPAWIGKNYPRAKLLALGASVIVVAAVFCIGYLRFINPVTTRLDVKIAKPAHGPSGDLKTLRIAVASDWHLGDIIGAKRLRDYVARVNALGADIILLPGDIVDRSVVPLEKQGMGPELAKLRAPLGVYAVLGNHERYAGAGTCEAFLEKHGIRVLRDEALPIAGGAFWLAGRMDGPVRASLAQVLAASGVDRAKPIILMDHQPVNLREPAAAGVDLQFSGHTHGGQIWPVTWIVPFLYEVPRGYKRIGNFQVYVTSGLGLWGFPARIGSSSELLDVHVEFSR